MASHRVPARYYIGVEGTRQAAAYLVALANCRPSRPDLNRGLVALNGNITLDSGRADRVGPGPWGFWPRFWIVKLPLIRELGPTLNMLA